MNAQPVKPKLLTTINIRNAKLVFFISRFLLLGLISRDDKAKKSIERVGAELRDRLDTAEQNIRLFLAVKAFLDAAAETVGLDIPGKGGTLANPYMRLGAFIALYNIWGSRIISK